MNNPLILCRDLTRQYKMGAVTVHALRGLNLEIATGEFIVLLGPSGSGKTTTLNLVGGLDRPTGGAVLVGGEDITRYNEKQLTRYRREQVGFVFQFFNLIPTLTASENVEFALKLNGSNGRSATSRALELLDIVGLRERANHFPAELSGGEQQRVSIARALANHPALLLCDEPTGNLDVKTGHQVLQAIRDLNREEGTTVILVTHNTAIAPMADRIVRLSDGQIDSITVQDEPELVAELAW
ncbi:MAG: ABC transporter ATP-binding protein [Chloroflexota bacterium]